MFIFALKLIVTIATAKKLIIPTYLPTVKNW